MISSLDARWIDELTEADLEQVGAKVFRLSELGRLGICVPAGFVIPADALRSFLETSGLAEHVVAAVNELDPNDNASLEVAAKQISAWFAASALPSHIVAPIAAAYRRLCDRYEADVAVAVRSSGTREDGANASFAGQYVTVLGVCGLEAILVAVTECWASAFSARVLGYALHNGISPLDAPLAVGVMTLVQARSAGVAFSAHPITGSRSRMVIEGSWGWGEAVVQGLVTPDYIELDKADGRVLTYNVKEKHVWSQFDAAAGRITESPMPAELVAQRVLDPAEIRSLHRYLVAIENFYGTPVDVEWAVDDRHVGDERVVILQTRPVTRLPQPPMRTWDPYASAMRFGFTGGVDG